MKASDYIVEFIQQQGITAAFGYPGGMVTHLLDSFAKQPENIAHLCYHEQAAAFAACGYSFIANKPGVAYATSGPGATNLITGICNAYFDSTPAIFITGQVNTFETKEQLPVRQKGFQETDIVSIVKSVTKYAARIENATDLRCELEKAYYIAMEGRRGPVLLDIPMDIQRAEIDPEKLTAYQPSAPTAIDYPAIKSQLLKALATAKQPLLLAGAAIKTTSRIDEFRRFAEITGIPVISSMPAFDIMPDNHPQRMGFVGIYGHRSANIAAAKSDLIITIGTRLSTRQTGSITASFAPDAKIIRIDIDQGEFANKIKPHEIQITADLVELLALAQQDNDFSLADSFINWRHTCNKINSLLNDADKRMPNDIIAALSIMIPDQVTITTDVGQNQVWVAQSFINKPGQRVLFSAGHGAMGFSLPAAIGAQVASGGKVFCFCGDGGLQMNIQEFQYLATEKIPVKVIILNNHALGMIRHFQEMYFDSIFTHTIEGSGFTAPDFCRIATAYDIPAQKISSIEELPAIANLIASDGPAVIEISLTEPTYIVPKLAFNKPMDEQEPLLASELNQQIMDL